MKTHVEWFSAEQAAAHLGFLHADGTPNARAFRTWLHRQPAERPRRHYLGRKLRFRRVELDACVETTPATTVSAPPLRLVGKGRAR